MSCLNWPVFPYPKEPNENYTLGEHQKPILVPVENKELINT
jgi:hypothetical protein